MATASKAIVFDHDEGFALRLARGPLACGHGVHPVNEAASLLRSQSPLCTQGRGTESVEEAPGRAGVPSDGENFLSHSGDVVSDSRSVRFMSANDQVSILPTLYNSGLSCLSCDVVRRALPVWPLVETSHPCVQLSSCHTAFVQGESNAERGNVLQSAPVGVPPSIEPVSYTHLTLPTNREV